MNVYHCWEVIIYYKKLSMLVNVIESAVDSKTAEGWTNNWFVHSIEVFSNLTFVNIKCNYALYWWTCTYCIFHFIPNINPTLLDKFKINVCLFHRLTSSSNYVFNITLLSKFKLFFLCSIGILSRMVVKFTFKYPKKFLKFE